MVFITLGAGGDVSSGAGPVVAQEAKEARYFDRGRGDEAIYFRRCTA